MGLWLALGTATAGVGVALFGASGVAAADTGSARADAPSSHANSVAARQHAGTVRQVGKSDAPRRTSTRSTRTPAPTSPAPDLAGALWTSVGRLHHVFFDSRPTVHPTGQSEDPATGVITGSLGGHDSDGDVISYSVTSAPQYGTVVVSASGNYTYTPDPGFAITGGTDSFIVSASDDTPANPWHLHGLDRLATAFAIFLSRLGVTPPPDTSTATTVLTEVPVTAPSAGVFAPYIDMGSIAQREQTWYMNDSTDPAVAGTPSLVATMTKTGITAATLAFVNQQSAGGPLVWGSAASPSSNIAFESVSGVAIKRDVQAALGQGLQTIVSFGGITACQNGVEIGQLNGQASTVTSDPVTGTGQTSVTLNLPQPIDFANMEVGSIAGRFTLNGAVTELYQVDADGKFTFSHQVTYEVPTAIGGTLASDGSSITIQLDSPLYANQGQAGTTVSYGLQQGFDQMKQAYKSAIQYFYDLGIRHFDLDIEGPALSIDQWGINNQRIRVFKSLQDENAFPGMKLSFVLPIGPNTGWSPVTDPGRLIQAAGQAGLDVSTWNMMAFDYGPQTYRYMLQNDADMVDMLIGEADTGIAVDPNFPIKGAVDYLVDFGLATDRQDAFHKLGVTLMVGQDDTVYVPGDTPAGFSPGDAATVEAITPDEVGGTGPGPTVLSWAQQNGVGLLSFWSLGRDRPSYNTASYNPTLAVTYQTGSPASPTVETAKVAGGGSSSVALPFEPSSRSVTGGNLYNANNEWLGTFQVQGSTVTIAYVPARVVKPTGGSIDTVTGQLQLTFNGGVADTVFAKLDYSPEILAEYQDRDLVYTQLLNQFD
ncbi:MAG: Ig-like domain-containing protein [Mycobacterium sp.]